MRSNSSSPSWTDRAASDPSNIDFNWARFINSHGAIESATLRSSTADYPILIATWMLQTIMIAIVIRVE